MQYDKKLWQMAGKLNYAVAHLRSLIGGASTQWSAAYVWRAVNLLRRTTKWAGLLDFNLDFLTLRSLVRDALSEFGWTVEGNGWRHVDCGFFNLSTEAHRVGHMLRESWRRLHYGKLAGSNRHELHGEVIPAYDEQRCTNVRKKARLHRNVGFCLVTGAVQSAKVRAVGRGGKEIRCGICHQTGHSWDELRHCVKQAAPVHLSRESLEHDVLSRRFVWDPLWIPFYASKVKKQMQ